MLYSYVLAVDRGLAPNPFGGICTLTLCKPIIRRNAEKDDWVIGTGSRRNGEQDSLIYAMKVEEKIPIRDYDDWCKKNSPVKIPGAGHISGDCIYYFDKGIPHVRPHAFHTAKHMKHDLSGVNSLISKHFYYFGRSPVLIPEDLRYIIRKGRNHLKFEDDSTTDKFEAWIKTYKLGLNDNPHR
jgi:hypothetical protein